MEDRMISYITALIDENRFFTENLEHSKDEESELLGMAYQHFLAELEHLTAFIASIPTESPFEVFILKRTINELKESCQNSADVEKNLLNKIDKLESEIITTNRISSERKKKIEDFNKNNWSK